MGWFGHKRGRDRRRFRLDVGIGGVIVSFRERLIVARQPFSRAEGIPNYRPGLGFADAVVITEITMSKKVIYTAITHASGGRDGAARSSDGQLDVKLARPGASDEGTNPEQLFAAGWSACFISSMEVAARARNITLPADRAVDAEVDLYLDDGAYFLRARLDVSLPGMDLAAAQALVAAGHEICPYSKATRGNVDVTVRLVEPRS
jgi:osmotically inducible protein OsmC